MACKLHSFEHEICLLLKEEKLTKTLLFVLYRRFNIVFVLNDVDIR